MRTAKSVILSILALFALAVVTNQVALADSLPSDRTVVILADRQAVIGTEGGMDLIKSFTGLVSSLRPGQAFIYVNADNATHLAGPAIAGEPEFRAFENEVLASLAKPSSGKHLDFSAALTETYNLLGSGQAAPGSSVYFITGGSPTGDLTEIADRLKPLMGLFADNGWPVVSLAMPGSSAALNRLLTDLSAMSGADSLELSELNGLKGLSDMILRDEAKGSLVELGGGLLDITESLASSIDVAPGTSELTLMFFKEGPYGSLRLSNPSGLQASAGDRTSSTVVETPHVVIWKLVDPTPGRWRVDIRGVQGGITAWHNSTTRYGVALVSYGTVPVNDPTTLVAYVTEGQNMVVLEGVAIVAKVTTPEGITLEHQLYDNGVSGDSVAGDGYFSARISPVAVGGDYGVDLQVFWPEFGHSVSTRAGFTAQAFPALDLVPVQVQDLRPNERTKVATLTAHIEGQAFAVPVDQLEPAIASNTASPGVLELVPQRLVNQGRAWQYDLFFTPSSDGLHTLTVHMDIDYAGRQYTFTAEPLVLSSQGPVIAPALAAPIQPAPDAPVAASVPKVPGFQSSSNEEGFPWTLLIILLTVAAGVVSVAFYLNTRTGPFGYVYNDRNEPVINFANLRRHPVLGLLFKNSVSGKDLGVPDLEGVTFNFSGEKVGLRTRRGAPTVRVNNQPLIGKTTIQDRAWIGVHGRLYSFLFSPPKFTGEPAVGDDD